MSGKCQNLDYYSCEDLVYFCTVCMYVIYLPEIIMKKKSVDLQLCFGRID